MTIGKPGRRGERGATAVMVALLLIVIAGFLALVMNVGRLMMVRGQLHNGTDSGALAGAKELNGTVEGVAAAKASAVAWANQHVTDKTQGLAVTAADVDVGFWDISKPRATAFTAITGTTPEELDSINAVRVVAGREASRGNAVPTIMAGVLSQASTNVAAESVAVYGGACNSACAIPIVFSNCIIKDPITHDLNCETELVFNSDNTDNIGFTNLAEDPSVNTNTIRNLMRNGQNCSQNVEVNDNIGVANGNNFAPVFPYFAELVGETVVVPVVNLGECPSKFNAHSPTAPVMGFASFTITRVAGPPLNTIYLSGKCEWVADKTFAGGCEFMGTTPVTPRLVR